MMVSRSRHPLRIYPYLFTLLLVMFYSLPVRAEEPSAEGKVLTMTGLMRDGVKVTAAGMKFTGLRRQSAVTTTPVEAEKHNQSKTDK